MGEIMINILVLEDHPLLLLAMRDILEVEGYTVFIAADGLEGWTVLQQHPVDLVVAGYSMPNLNGLELLQRMRADPRFVTLPVLITSSLEKERFLAHGVNSFIQKPFDPQDLVEQVNSLLNP
jgi:two-component system chemotaxis response regulator CheY